MNEEIVAVKVQRPGLREQITLDLYIVRIIKLIRYNGYYNLIQLCVRKVVIAIHKLCKGCIFVILTTTTIGMKN